MTNQERYKQLSENYGSMQYDDRGHVEDSRDHDPRFLNMMNKVRIRLSMLEAKILKEIRGER